MRSGADPCEQAFLSRQIAGRPVSQFIRHRRDLAHKIRTGYLRNEIDSDPLNAVSRKWASGEGSRRLAFNRHDFRWTFMIGSPYQHRPDTGDTSAGSCLQELKPESLSIFHAPGWIDALPLDPDFGVRRVGRVV